jgi:hypothetical protein
VIDCDSIRQILQDIGYVLTDHGKEFRAKPLYRDSDNDKVLRIWKDSGRWVDFKENKSGSIEDLVRLSLNLSSINEAKNWISTRAYNQPLDSETARKPKPNGQPIFKSNYERMQYLAGKQNRASCGVKGKAFSLGRN